MTLEQESETQDKWVPEAAFTQNEVSVPGFWQVSAVQALLSLQSASFEQDGFLQVPPSHRPVEHTVPSGLLAEQDLFVPVQVPLQSQL